jgi:GT2 family glycosyltransferase
LIIILINWRNEQQTLACARALKAWQVFKPCLLVVDNESTEASRGALRLILKEDEIQSSVANVGYGGGNNLGIAWALAKNYDYILLLNSDAEISEAGLIRLVQRLDANPQISALGPVLNERSRLLAGGRNVARFPTTRIAVAKSKLKTLPGFPFIEVDYVPGAVFLARASVFRSVGLLDEDFFFSGEIADFCKRAKDRGHKFMVDLEVEARHRSAVTTPCMRDVLYDYYNLRNRFLYVKKHHASRKTMYFAYWTGIGAVSLCRALACGKVRKAQAILLALAHAHTDHYGIVNARFVRTKEVAATRGLCLPQS